MSLAYLNLFVKRQKVPVMAEIVLPVKMKKAEEER